MSPKDNLPCRQWNKARRFDHGSALVIVLCMIVLCTTLILAFFARSTSESSTSRATANSATSSILARTAKELIIGDLRQEIVDGSQPPANPVHPVYVPLSPTNAMPARVATTDTLPNLLKRSASGVNFNGTNGVARIPRASSISTGNATLEGRTFSVDRWNAPRLLPLPPTAGNSSVTPIADFVLPDWIYLTRSGANCIGTTLAAANKSNGTDPILGRFAYTIYDEGGLLDVNCAGYPSALAATEVAKKGFLALADLTKTGLDNTEVEKLVAWRNASTAAKPTNFLKNLQIDPSNFRQVAEGDQAFVSRLQLLSFFTQKSLNKVALPLLGTFSRGLNQPSFGVVGPAIPATAAPPPTPAPTGGGYTLTNYNNGNNLVPSTNQNGSNGINPVLLDTRVVNEFNRFNPAQTTGNATQAKEGDPLIAKRFPLSRLAWLTYIGPIAPGGTLTNDTNILTPLHNAGLTDDFLKLGTEANILKAFGLTWSDDPAGTGHKVWVYDHGITNLTRYIGRLSDVAALAGTGTQAPREPDFLELLKATIHIGSLGKGAASSTGVGLWQHARDINPDIQLLQIFANIIDQYDSDGYPTEIALPANCRTWGNASTPAVATDIPGLFEMKVRGIENLPYLYCMNIGLITLRQSTPAVLPTDSPLPTPSGNTTVTDPGLAAVLLNPWIWNPHSSLSGNSSAQQPTTFRSITFSGDPIHPVDQSLQNHNALASLNVCTTYTTITVNGNQTADPNFSTVIFPSSNGTVTGGQLFQMSPYPSTSAADPTELDFSVSSGSFTQPTALIFPGVPQNSKLQTRIGHAIRTLSVGNSGYLTNPQDSNRQYVGVLLGTFPIRAIKPMSGNITSGPIDNVTTTPFSGNYILTANSTRGDYNHSMTGQMNQATCLLQYSSASNRWVTYDVKSFQARAAGFSAQGYIAPGEPPVDPLQPAASNGYFAFCADPRTMRFGVPTDLGYGNQTISTGNATIGTIRPGVAVGHGAWTPTGPGQGNTTPSTLAQMGWITRGLGNWYYPGLLAENNATLTTAYMDPDGVTRGGMAIYSPASSTLGKPQATTLAAGDNPDLSRPIILNRPFRSVAELGYVFRDQPFKQLDFFTPSSGDSALLDTFCIKEDQTTDGVVVGKANLNTRNSQVLDAVLSGVGRDVSGAMTINSTETTTLATTIRDWTKNTGPFTSLGDVVGRYRNNAYESFYSASPTTLFTGGATSANNILQRYREAPIRALADVGEVRVWNLLIDVVAQSGICGPNSTSLGQFSLRGETRLWIHIAIDRATGQIVDQQVEHVTE